MKVSLNKKFFLVFLLYALCTLYPSVRLISILAFEGLRPVFCTSVFAQDTQTNEPILITSDRVEYFDKTKESEFTGNVRAVQGKLLLTAAKLKVNFDPLGQKIQKFLATGNVKLVQEEISTTSDTATFFNDEQKAVLTGKPHAFSKSNEFSGKKITIYLKENRIMIETGVKGTIFPE